MNISIHINISDCVFSCLFTHMWNQFNKYTYVLKMLWTLKGRIRLKHSAKHSINVIHSSNNCAPRHLCIHIDSWHPSCIDLISHYSLMYDLCFRKTHIQLILKKPVFLQLHWEMFGRLKHRKVRGIFAIHRKKGNFYLKNFMEIT